MRAILIATITSLIIICSAPAFAEWSADLSSGVAPAPLAIAACAAKQAPALLLSRNPGVAEAPKPQPIPVFTLGKSAASAIPAVYAPVRETPRYMVTYQVAANSHMLGQAFVANPQTAVPEPASLLTLATGVVGLAARLRLRKR